MPHMKKDSISPYLFDHKPGLFLTYVLFKMFKKMDMDPKWKERLRELHRQGTIVYAIKYRGALDYLLFHYGFRSKRLPYPRYAFGMKPLWICPLAPALRYIWHSISGLFSRKKRVSEESLYNYILEHKIPSLLFLIDPKIFRRHFMGKEPDYLQFLIQAQSRISHPIIIIPQFIIYHQAPEKEEGELKKIFFGLRDRPGAIIKMILFFRFHRQVFVDFGSPFNLREYLKECSSMASVQEIARSLRDRLIEEIDRQKRIILGPIMKSRDQIMEMVLTDPRITSKIEKMGKGDKRKIRYFKKKAKEYFQEIAADYSITYVQIFTLLLKRLWKRMFDDIDIRLDEISTLREWARKGTLVYVPSHKSHMDYLILNHMLYLNHMHTPRIAAGRNLAFWPVGHIFRKSGAFFIRRTFTGAKLYSEVFNRYIKILLSEGYPIEFFIEGGRSRNGKLVIPKTGFLSILIQAYREGCCNDIIFVPASIIYDRIVEQGSLLREITGAEKQREDIWMIFKARNILKRKYGKVYIRFNRPISLREYMEGREDHGKDESRDLALILINAINQVTVITPISIVSTAILSTHRNGFQASWLKDSVRRLYEFLQHIKAPFSDSLNDMEDAVDETLKMLADRKVVEILNPEIDEEEPFFYVEDNKKLELDYYKNCIIHYFLEPSLLSLIILKGKERKRDLSLLFDEFQFLKEILRNEFAFLESEINSKILNTLRYFETLGYIRLEDDSFYPTLKGIKELPLFGNILKSFLESYWIASRAMEARPSKKGKGLLKYMSFLGKRYQKLNIISNIESLSHLNFQNAISSLNDLISGKGNLFPKELTRSEILSQISKRLYKYIQI